MSLKENFYDISFFAAYNSLKKSHDKLSITTQTMVRCPLISRKEKSLGHVSMVAKFLDDNKPNIHSKREFALFQT